MLDKKTDTQTLSETKGLATETASVVETKEVTEVAPNISVLKVTQETNQELKNTTDKASAQLNIEEITTEIIRQKGYIVQSFIEIGRLLIEAKEQLKNGHGHWLKWLSTSVDISERMAQRYMQLAEEYANTTSVTDLGMTKALALLSLPEADRQNFINESHEINGKEKKVSEMSTREIKNAIREKKRATAKPQTMFKPINRDDYKSSAIKLESEPASNSLNDFATNLESARSHLDYIVDFLAEQEENPALLVQYADELRSLYEKTLECIALARLEVS